MKEVKIPVTSYEEFQNQAAKNPNLLNETPWIIDGFIKNWPRYDDWRQISWLKERFGDIEGFARAPQFITNKNDNIYGVETNFSDYIDYIRNPDQVREIYNGDWLYGSCDEFLKQDMPLYCGSLKLLNRADDDIFNELHPLVPPPLENWNAALPYYYQLFNHFWLLVSLPKALTPLHQDNNGTIALIAQLKGKKRAILYHPNDEQYFFNPDVGFMDPVNPNEADFPNWEKAQPWTGDLCEGQMLIIGANWGHHVETLETSISVSLDFVNQSNIDAYAASPQWPEVFGKRIKARPAMVTSKMPDLITEAEIESMDPVSLGRLVISAILKSAIAQNPDSETAEIRRILLGHLNKLTPEMVKA